MIALVPVLLLSAIWDIARKEIPNALVASGILVALTINAQAGWSDFLYSLIGGVVGLAVLVPLYLKGLVGAGDCKLLCMIGVIVGFPHVIIASLIGMGVGTMCLTIIMAGKYGTRFGGRVPYAPFLVSGALIAMSFGQTILDTWLGSVQRLF